MTRKAKEDTVTAYHSGGSVFPSKYMHVGTKRAAIERAFGHAARAQTRFDEWNAEAEQLLGPQHVGKLRYGAILWLTTVHRFSFDIDDFIESNDDGNEDSHLPIHAFQEEDARRASRPARLGLRGLFRRPPPPGDGVKVLAYYNVSEDPGSRSYVIRDPSRISHDGSASVAFLIQKLPVDLPEGALAAVTQVLEKKGNALTPHFVTYEEFVTKNRRRDSGMVLSNATMDWIENLRF